MKIGEKIKRIRKLRGMTQKELGLASGFNIQSADVRIAQYELGTRTPKEEFRRNIAEALNINSLYLSDHSIGSIEDVIFALFDIDETQGISISLVNGKPCLMFNTEITKHLQRWYNMKNKLEFKETEKEEYLNWKYNYCCK